MSLNRGTQIELKCGPDLNLMPMITILNTGMRKT